VAPISLMRRKISFRSDTKFEAAANRVVVPPGGSSGDPRGAAGGTLVVYNSDPAPGSPTDDYVIALPSGSWTALGAGTVTGYVFRGTDRNGPVSRITVKADSISIRGGKANWPYTLDEPSRLLGSRCEDCGEHFFPRRAVCAKCLSERTADVLLGPRGTVYSYTFVHFPLFGSTRLEHVGYGVGQVDLPEGPRVQLPLA